MRHFHAMTWIVLFIFPLLSSELSYGKTSAPLVSEPNLSEKELLIELTGKDQGRMSEVDLYSEIVSAFQTRDEIGLKSRLQTFMSRFPKSSFADNALYLAGKLDLDQKRYGSALQNFQRILTEYPRSNRAVSAQFAKAMTYKKMNLDGEARRNLKDVTARYPGSPESFRAEGEMRLFR